VEFRIVWDADHIVNLQEQRASANGAEGTRTIKVLRTKTGQEMVQQLRRH